MIASKSTPSPSKPCRAGPATPGGLVHANPLRLLRKRFVPRVGGLLLSSRVLRGGRGGRGCGLAEGERESRPPGTVAGEAPGPSPPPQLRSQAALGVLDA